MWAGIELVETNLGMSFEIIVSLVLFMANLVIFAVDWKKGVIFLLVVYSAIFIWFYNWGLNYTVPLVMAFLSLALMSFTIYFTSKLYNQQVI